MPACKVTRAILTASSMPDLMDPTAWAVFLREERAHTELAEFRSVMSNGGVMQAVHWKEDGKHWCGYTSMEGHPCGLCMGRYMAALVKHLDAYAWRCTSGARSLFGITCVEQSEHKVSGLDTRLLLTRADAKDSQWLKHTDPDKHAMRLFGSVGAVSPIDKLITKPRHATWQLIIPESKVVNVFTTGDYEASSADAVNQFNDLKKQWVTGKGGDA